jgi:hypothetical protein
MSATSDEARAFVQERVSGYMLWIGLLGLGFWVYRGVGVVLDPSPDQRFSDPAYFLHFFGAGSFVLTGLVNRGRPRSRRFIERSEMVGMTAGSLFYAAMAAAIPHGARPDLILALILTYALFSRAVYVPSTAARTLKMSAALELARAGRLHPRALPLLRAHVAAADFEDDVPWTVRRAIPILAEAGDTESGPAIAIAAILADIPAEGGFETSLKWDDFVGEIAGALRTLGDPAHAEPLLRFASSPALRMRDARTGAARAVADLAPEHGTEPMLMNLVEMTARINDSEENSAALLAVAKCAPRLDDDARGRLRATLDGTEPMALNYEEVELARALALRATGAEADVAAAMEGCLTKPGWKEEYTVRRRRFALETLALEPVEPERLLPFLEMRDPALTAETLAALAALGHPAEAARTLTWFEVEDMGGAQVMAAALDPALGGRHQAIRALASHGEAARDTLETVARGALDRAPENPSGDLTEADGRMLREAVRALLQLPEAESTTSLWDVMLRHPNRDAKWEILQDPPAIAALADAMRVVAAEKWGWQETTARRWLDAHG